MDNNRFWILLSRCLSGEISKEEEKELEDLLETSNDLKLRYDALLEHWGKTKKHTDIDVELAYQKVSQRMEKRTATRRLFFENSGAAIFLKVAAILFFCFSIGWIYISHNDIFNNASSVEVKHNSKGEKSKLTLSDGSTVWLNADSELRYPKSFTKNQREIYLVGEAFFDVASDPQKPFIIHLTDGTIRVLGTSFNVKSFPGDETIETSVLTGKVAFIPLRPMQDSVNIDTIMLKPNFKFIYSRNPKIRKIEKTNTQDDKAWVEGRIIFKSTSFEEVGKVLERTYGKGVIFDSENLKNCRLTGVFQNNTLEEILKLFAETNDYQYSISGNEIHIGGSGCTNE